MGTSTDAMLLYGIPLDEDAFEEFDEDSDTQESNPVGWLSFMGEHEDGITIEAHCSHEVPHYFAAIQGTCMVAHRGHPKRITDHDTETHPEWDAELRQFLKKHKLKKDGEPGWYLASWWG